MSSESAASSGTDYSIPHDDLARLTAFQRDILRVLQHRDHQKGLSIKQSLESYYAEEVNHGRLYPNLDQLVDAGLIEKSERDKRTNDYALTGRGRGALANRDEWNGADA
ncbi:PadR family transcriptional regulator [Haloparvum sedimenti]|uniref:PadR family transcriptional regulator n=1 Tax=Haloparvum sedimenti TaxID=1678448 RepID=UPI0009B5C43C|nr:helix-turn-helix transcriptional regulator [Haloparvum sedimenti]